MRAGHRGLDDVDAGVDAAGDGKRRRDAPGQRRHAAQAQRQLGGIRQRQRANHVELIDVDVHAVEAREEHEPVGAGLLELFGEMREARVRSGASLTATGMRRLRFTSRTMSIACSLHVGGARAHVAGRVIDVQLEAVRAGLLEQPRVRDPAARSDSVERGDDRDVDCLLHRPQMLEIFVGAERDQRVGRE